MGSAMQLRSQDLAVSQLDDETVLLDLRKSSYISVKGSGVELVRLLSDNRSETDLVSALVAKFDVGEAQAATDVRQFLDGMRDRGLLDE